MMNLQIRQEVTPHKEGWWDWAIWLDGPADELEEVEYVEYILHPTFSNPVQKISNRTTNFRLQKRGWGEFNIQARVHLDNDEIIRLEHWLELDVIAPTRGMQESSMKRPRFRMKIEHPMLYLSSAMADMKYSYALKDALEDEGMEVVMNQDLDDEEPLEVLLETKQASFQAGLFVISDIRNPAVIHEYWAIQKSKISSLVVQIGEPQKLPDELEDLPRYQIKDVAETEDVAANIARRLRDQF